MNSTRHSKKAIVIGCSIGGPVVAMALQRAGIEAVIYEAYDRPADYVGSFLAPLPMGWTRCAYWTPTRECWLKVSRHLVW